LRASSQSLAIASLVALPLSLCHAAPLRINGAQVGFRVSGLQVGSVSVWGSGSESGQWLAGAAAVNLLHSPKLQLQQSVVLLLPPTIYHNGRGCGGDSRWVSLLKFNCCIRPGTGCALVDGQTPA